MEIGDKKMQENIEKFNHPNKKEYARMVSNQQY